MYCPGIGSALDCAVGSSVADGVALGAEASSCDETDRSAVVSEETGEVSSHPVSAKLNARRRITGDHRKARPRERESKDGSDRYIGSKR
jgi:hypothetical protein